MAKNKNSVSSEKSEFESKRKSDIRFWFRLLSLVVIVPVYAAIIICLLALPRSTVSNIEKRELAQFPEFSWESYWSGEYTADIANYYDDTVPLRDTLKQAASQLLNFVGIKYGNVQVSGQMVVVNDTSNTNEDTQVNDTSSENTQTTSTAVSSDTSSDKDTDSESNYGQEIADGIYTNGQIVVYLDGHYRAMSMYGGGTGDVYAASLNNFASDLPEVNIYSMVCPTQSEFYTPQNFSQYNASQEDSIKSIADQLVGVKSIDICPVLEKHVSEDIYTRTDHHWQALGAYYAAQEFAKTAGVSFKDISTYNKVSIDGYVGTMYAFTDNNADLLNDPETFTYYEPSNSYTTEYYSQAYEYVYSGNLLVEIGDTSSLYMTFMGGDSYAVKIKTDVNNGRKLCVVKDSYGNAEIPFYTGSFEEIYVIDMRYFEVNLVDFVKQMGITDLLFSMSSYSAVGVNADNLENLRTQNKGAVIGDSGDTSSENESSESVDSSIDEYADNDNTDDYSDDYGNDANYNDYGNDYGYGDNYEDDYWENDDYWE